MSLDLEHVLREIAARARAQDVPRLIAALRLAMDGPEVDEDRQVPEGAWERFEKEIVAALRAGGVSEPVKEPAAALTP